MLFIVLQLLLSADDKTSPVNKVPQYIEALKSSAVNRAQPYGGVIVHVRLDLGLPGRLRAEHETELVRPSGAKLNALLELSAPSLRRLAARVEKMKAVDCMLVSNARQVPFQRGFIGFKMSGSMHAMGSIGAMGVGLHRRTAAGTYESSNPVSAGGTSPTRTPGRSLSRMVISKSWPHTVDPSDSAPRSRAERIVLSASQDVIPGQSLGTLVHNGRVGT